MSDVYRMAVGFIWVGLTLMGLTLTGLTLTGLTLIAPPDVVAGGAERPARPEPPTLELVDDHGDYPLGLYAAYLKDPSGDLTLADVSSPVYAPQFVPSSQRAPNFGLTSAAFWLRIKIRNISSPTENWLLEIAPPYLDSIDVYLSSTEGPSTHKHLGDLQPFHQREIHNRHFLVNLPLPTSAERTLYLRVENKGHLPVLMTLLDSETFASSQQTQLIELGFLYGAMLMVAGYNGLLFLTVRDRLYLYFSFYALAHFLVYFAGAGFGFQYLWPHQVGWQNVAVLNFRALATIAHFVFTARFLQLRRHSPALERLLYVGALVVVGLWLGWLFTDVAFFRQIAMLLGGPTVLALLGIGAYAWYRGESMARYYLFIWGLYGAGALVNVLALTNVIPVSPFTMYVDAYAFVAMLLLLSLALAARINLTKREKEAAQAQVLAVAQEKERLLREQTRLLDEQVQARTAELRASEENYRLIMETARNGIFRIAPDGTVSFVNPAYTRIYGYRLQDIVGASFQKTVSESSHAQARDLFAQLLAGESISGEIVARHRDGHTFPVYFSAAPIVKDERVIGVTGTVRDITERKRTEKALHELNETLERRVEERTRDLKAEILQREQVENELKRRHEELITLNAITTMLSQSLDLEHTLTTTLDIVLTLSKAAAGCMHLLNREQGNLSLAAQRGLSQEAITEIQTLEIRERLDINENVRQIEKFALSAGWRCLISVPLSFKDTTLGFMSLLAPQTANNDRATAHFVDESGYKLSKLLSAIGHQVGVAIENERLARAATEAKITQEMDHLRSELVGNVSHELRTPLGLIKATVTTLLAKDIQFDQQTQWTLLEGIDEETDRLEKIVNNLLDLSHIEQKGLRLHPKPTNLNQLAQDVIEAMQVQTAQCRFVHDFPSNSLVATIDASRIEQVLRNLLSNAVKYSPKGGIITVRGRKEENHLLISVSDQGIGIPPTDLPKIFTRFYRGNHEITQRVRGAGLGLAISREIVQAHGGQIWAESEPGQGSTFYFTLRVAISNFERA